MGALNSVAQGFFNTPLENLQADAPQRVRLAGTQNVPGSGSALLNVQLLFPGLPSMTRGMALLMEHLHVLVAASASPGLGIAAGELLIGFQESSIAGQVLTYNAGQVTATGLNVICPVTIEMPPVIATDQDLVLESFGNLAIPTPVVLPLKNWNLNVTLSFVNSAVGAITATVLVAGKMRFLRGLQEN